MPIHETGKTTSTDKYEDRDASNMADAAVSCDLITSCKEKKRTIASYDQFDAYFSSVLFCAPDLPTED